MTTHRLLQIHNLEDTCNSVARMSRRGADNLARIGNDGGAASFLRRAMRHERVAAKCRVRLEVAP